MKVTSGGLVPNTHRATVVSTIPVVHLEVYGNEPWPSLGGRSVNGRGRGEAVAKAIAYGVSDRGGACGA